MIMCLQNLVSICQFVLKILSKNQILTSINGRNSDANLPKCELIRAFMHILVTCNNEEDPIKMRALECSQDFSHYKSMGIFSRRSRAAYSAVHGRIWSNFELVQDFMVVLVTYKNEEEPIKNEGTGVFTTLYINFLDAHVQTTLELVVASGRNFNLFKLSCMSSLPARMRMIESKMKELGCSQDFSYYEPMEIFPDAQGQLTPQSLVRSGRISNSSEMLWMSSLPANMKKIRIKNEGARVFTTFSPL